MDYFKPTYWCQNCKHLLPLNGNESRENSVEWWINNREHFRLMHLNGDCNTKDNQLVNVSIVPTSEQVKVKTKKKKSKKVPVRKKK